MKQFFLVLLVLVFASSAFAKDVTLSWDPSPTESVTGYFLYYSTSPDQPFPTVIDVGDVLTHTVEGLEDMTAYYFGVAAYDIVGQESVYSNIVMSPAFLVPEPPSGLRGTSTVNNVDVPIE